MFSNKNNYMDSRKYKKNFNKKIDKVPLIYFTIGCFSSKEFFSLPPLSPHIYFISTSKDNPYYLVKNTFIFSVTGLNLNRLTTRILYIKATMVSVCLSRSWNPDPKKNPYLLKVSPRTRGPKNYSRPQSHTFTSLLTESWVPTNPSPKSQRPSFKLLTRVPTIKELNGKKKPGAGWAAPSCVEPDLLILDTHEVWPSSKALGFGSIIQRFLLFMWQIVGRAIMMRDVNHFHHFEAGVCSRMDYWWFR
jgi:hypothetical protein